MTYIEFDKNTPAGREIARIAEENGIKLDYSPYQTIARQEAESVFESYDIDYTDQELNTLASEIEDYILNDPVTDYMEYINEQVGGTVEDIRKNAEARNKEKSGHKEKDDLSLSI